VIAAAVIGGTSLAGGVGTVAGAMLGAVLMQSLYQGHDEKVVLVVAEALNWLRVQGLIVPAPGVNGAHGWLVLSRRGKLETGEDFTRFSEAASFPKHMLHLSIADKVWLDLMRGDLADAVFSSFRAVEEAVREAGGCGDAVIGVDLMRRAFDPKGGPLTDLSQEEGGAA
jgi:hypothetical protein